MESVLPVCVACPLHTEVKHVCMPGLGNPASSIFLVVERPYYMEDESGQSFSAQLSTQLFQYMKKAGMVFPEGAYVTYLAKCYVDIKDSKGKRESILTCPPLWLEKELEKYKPSIVVALGAEVSRRLLGFTGSIHKHRGTIADCTVGTHSFKVIPTYSPAFLAQGRGELEVLLIKDLKRAQSFAAGTSQQWDMSKLDALNYRLVESMSDFREMISEFRTYKKVSCDIETRKANPNKTPAGNGFPIVSIQFSTHSGSAWFLPIAHEIFADNDTSNGVAWNIPDFAEIVQTLRGLLEGDEVFLIGHNFKFDAKWLKRWLSITPRLNFDTMLAHGLFEETSNSLKKIAWEITDIGGYEEEQSVLTKSLPAEKQYDMYFYPFDKLVIYGCADADVTFRAYEKFNGPLQANPKLLYVFNMLIAASRAFTDIESEGICIDEPYLKELGASLDLDAKLLEQQFRMTCASEITILEKRLLEAAIEKNGSAAKVKPISFNMGSNTQIRTMFFDIMGIPIDDKFRSKKTDAPSVGTPVLLKLENKYAFAAELLKWRKITKQKEAFVDSYPDYIVNGRVYPDYKLVKFFNEGEDKEQGTRTGRLACSDPNLQNVPARDEEGKKIKKLFLPDCLEHLFCNFDYAGIELRVAAMYCQDKLMKDFFNKGAGDFHKFVASKIHGCKEVDVTPSQRTYAKKTTFGILYQAGPPKIAEQIGCTVRQAEKFIKEYFDLFPGLKKWIMLQKAYAQKNLCVVSQFGRIRRLPDANHRTDGIREAALRKAVNTPIQADASDLTVYALCRIAKYLRDFKHFDMSKPSRIRGTVHDSILLTVHTNDLEEIITHVKMSILDKPALDFIIAKGVSLHADVSVGPNWGEQVDLVLE